jgi:hypothetical protein
LQAERQSLIDRVKELQAQNTSIETAVEEEQKRCQEILAEERSRHQQAISQMEFQLKEQKTKAQRFYQIILKQGSEDGAINESQLAKDFREMYYSVNNLVRSYYQTKKPGRPGTILDDRHWYQNWIEGWISETPEMRNHLAMAGVFSTLHKEIFSVLLFGVEPQRQVDLASFESRARDCKEGEVIS